MSIAAVCGVFWFLFFFSALHGGVYIYIYIYVYKKAKCLGHCLVLGLCLPPLFIIFPLVLYSLASGSEAEPGLTARGLLCF